VAVFGVPDERRGEIPVAAVVLKEGASLSSEEFDAFCRKHLGGYKVPRKLLIVDALRGFTGGNCCVGRSGKNSVKPAISKTQKFCDKFHFKSETF